MSNPKLLLLTLTHIIAGFFSAEIFAFIDFLIETPENAEKRTKTDDSFCFGLLTLLGYKRYSVTRTKQDFDMAWAIGLFWQQTAVDSGSWRRTIADYDGKIILF